MSVPADGRASDGPVRPSLRWSLPAALLVAEYAVLSVLVDFPTEGPALRVAATARMLVPAALGALSAGWLISRHGLRSALRDMRGALPPWRPAAPLLAHLAAFLGTAWLARRLLAPGAPPIQAAQLAALGACAAVCALLALATAAPLGWLASFSRRHLGAPLAAVAIGMLTWRAVALAEGLWGALQGSTLRAVGALLRAVRPDAVVLPERSIVGAGGFDVVIAPVCSGVDGLGLVLVFQALWLSLARGRLRVLRAFLLVPLGAAAALGANVLRIAALVLIGASGREALALGGFHSKLGWLLFIAIALATVAIAERHPWFRRPDAATLQGDEGVPRRAGAYAGPLVAAIAAALATSLWAEPGFDAWYGLRVGAAALVLVAVRRDLPRPALTVSWLPVLVGAAVGAAWIAWPHAGADAPPGLERLEPAARATWIAVRALGACLVLPLVEELAFRGFLLPWLVAADFEAVPPRAWTFPAVIVSSVAFGAVHDQLVLGTAAGAAFAAARLWRGRLSDAFLAHAVANAGVTLAVLGYGRWDLWS